MSNSKTIIIVAAPNKEIANNSMHFVIDLLRRYKIAIRHMCFGDLILQTDHTRVIFAYDPNNHVLHGVRAHAIFGEEPFKSLYKDRLVPSAKYDHVCGVSTYIRRIETRFEERNKNMNKNMNTNTIMKLAEAKEVYLNCDGDIFPIRINTIRHYNDDIELICTLPSVIETTTITKGGRQGGVAAYLKAMYGDECPPVRRKSDPVEIKDVIFNPPATIVFWSDGKKTVVKAGEHDIYDPEKGLAMAITKRVLGNEGKYYNEIRKWVEPYLKKCEENCTPLDKALKNLGEALRENCSICNPIGKVTNVEQTEEGVRAKVEITNENWKIWFKRFDDNGKIGGGLYQREYKHKSSATRAAKKVFGDATEYEYVVSKTNPWGEESDASCQE